MARIRMRVALVVGSLLLGVLGPGGGNGAGGAGVARGDSTMSWGILSSDVEGTPAVLASDLRVFRRVLGLGDAEFDALEALHDAYVTRLEREGREVREFCTAVVEEAQLKGDSSVLGPAQERVEAWAARKGEMDRRFLEDVRVLLTAEQEGRWPLVEREMRRLKRMGDGRLHGESVDLIRLASGMGVEADGAGPIAEVLERYSRELDAALVRRDRRLEEAREDGFEELIGRDPDRARAIYERCLEARRAVRDANWRHMRLLAARLGEERGARLERRFFERAFWRLTQPTVAERYVEAALELPDLGDGQRARIEAMLDEYEPARDGILREMGEILMDRELELPAELSKDGQGPPRVEQPGVPLDGDDPFQELRVERWELDKAFREDVASVLRERQRAAMPNLARHAIFRAPSGGVRL